MVVSVILGNSGMPPKLLQVVLEAASSDWNERA